MVDRYTKATLTIIASCLVVIVARELPFVRQAFAQNAQTHVIIDGVSQLATYFPSIPLPVRTER